MTPGGTAAIALRVIALPILIWALSDLIRVIFLLLSSHPAPHASNPMIAPSFDRTQVVPPTHTFLLSTFPLVVMRFVSGLMLFFLSKPLGKLVAHGLE
jgi:hypothetical protein